MGPCSDLCLSSAAGAHLSQMTNLTEMRQTLATYQGQHACILGGAVLAAASSTPHQGYRQFAPFSG